jgi:hypothetical protein
VQCLHHLHFPLFHFTVLTSVFNITRHLQPADSYIKRAFLPSYYLSADNVRCSDVAELMFRELGARFVLFRAIANRMPSFTGCVTGPSGTVRDKYFALPVFKHESLIFLGRSFITLSNVYVLWKL